MTVSTFRNALRLAALGASMALAACGGGDDASPAPAPAPAPAPSPAPTPAPPAGSNDPKEAAGFWSGRVDAQTIASAVFLPEGQAWTVFQTSAGATTLARGTVTVAFPAVSVSGTRYTLGANAATSPYNLAGTVAPRSTLGVSATGGPTATPAYSLAYNAAYETPAKASDVTGRWVATFAGGTVRLTMDVSDSGALSGDSTSGCRYSGSLVPHPAQIAVYRLSLAETCPPAAGTTGTGSYAGIATLNEARTTLSAAFTSPDGSAGGVFSAGR